MDNRKYQGSTAWMVRRDGSIFPVVQHIYGNPKNVEETLFAAEWLYERTRCKQTRKDIETFVRMWGLQFAKETNDEELKNRIYHRIEERPYQFITHQFADKIADIITQWKELGGHTDEAMDINGYCRQVSLDLNEEFMRVRFGGKYHTEPGNRKLYFRVSSENYNWSRVIREFDNRVCPQLQSEGFIVMVDQESAEVNPAILKQRKYYMQEGERSMSIEEMRKEAAERMRLLGLLDEKEQSVIRDFEEEHKVYISRPMNLGVMTGVLYEWSDGERKLVEKVENKFQILVYHVIRNVTKIGILYAMLYVSSYEEEWPAERKALKGIETEGANPLAYVWNAGLQEEPLDLSKGFGDWGAILIVRGEGGICRIR